MSPLFGRRRRADPLGAQAAAALDAWRALPDVPVDAPVRSLRFVVVDVETSGLDPARDRLLAVGAVAVERTLVRFSDSFRVLVAQTQASTPQNILVHGISGDDQTSGAAPADALLRFLAYAGRQPLVAFHAAFDRAVIARAMRAALGVEPPLPWLDLALLAPAILSEHAQLATLDAWSAALGIANYRRHDALADALATAQLFQAVLARAIATGDTRLGDLVAVMNTGRWLARP